MKLSRRFTKSFTAFAVGVTVLVAGAGVAYAATANQSVSGVTNKSVYKFGSNITISGTVNGDVICAGQTIIIDAFVNGDVICAGQTVTISGKVSGDIRVAGQTILINSDLANNASVAGQDISISRSAKVGRDLGVVGQTISVDGPVGRDLETATNTIYINSTIGRNANASAADKLVLQDDGVIYGNLKYTSPTKLVKTGQSRVDGSVTYNKLETNKNQKRNWYVMWHLYIIAAIAVMSVVLVALFPQQFGRIGELANKKIGLAILTGFIALIMVPITVIGLFVSFVGIPLAILLLLSWIVVIILSIPVSFYAVGSRVMPKLHPVLMVLIATIVLGVIELIPFLGGLITFVLYLLGTGTVLLGLKQAYKKPVYTKKK